MVPNLRQGTGSYVCPVVSGHYQSEGLGGGSEESPEKLAMSQGCSILLLFIPWLCVHLDLNWYCSFSDWRKEHFHPGEKFFIYLFVSLLTAPHFPS